LILNLSEFSKIAEKRGDISRFENWSRHAINLKTSIETEAWDGEWYRRAFYDNGTALGSSDNLECRIDSLAQTWGVISGAGDYLRLIKAMESVEKFLIKNVDEIVLLFTPPFDQTPLDPGYIKGYLPGVRENGGQYSHAAIWCIYAYIGLNHGQKAVELFSMLNPINHGKDKAGINRYKVEPYVIAADIYSQNPHIGRGGWTWYTGSSSWMYRAGIEEILGFKLIGNTLKINPCIDPHWKQFKIYYHYLNSIYVIEIKNPMHLSSGISKYVVDGKELTDFQQEIVLVNDGLKHFITVELTLN
jgi:cyclic beta-1,2-glucan synthetase